MRRQRQIHIIPPDGFAAPLVGIQALYRGRGAFIRRCGGFAWGKFEIRYVGAAAECAGHLDGQPLNGPLHRLYRDAAFPLEQGLRLGFLENLDDVGRDSAGGVIELIGELFRERGRILCELIGPNGL